MRGMGADVSWNGIALEFVVTSIILLIQMVPLPLFSSSRIIPGNHSLHRSFKWEAMNTSWSEARVF